MTILRSVNKRKWGFVGVIGRCWLTSRPVWPQGWDGISVESTLLHTLQDLCTTWWGQWVWHIAPPLRRLAKSMSQCGKFTGLQRPSWGQEEIHIFLESTRKESAFNSIKEFKKVLYFKNFVFGWVEVKFFSWKMVFFGYCFEIVNINILFGW